MSKKKLNHEEKKFQVVDVPDGKEPVLGATVRNAVKIHSLLSDKWLLFCCRSSQSKARYDETAKALFTSRIISFFKMVSSARSRTTTGFK